MSLQEKLKPYLESPIQEISFPEHLSCIAKKLLLVERQHLVSLTKWEIILEQTISFDEQQQAFHNMIHVCKINKFKEVNFKIIHGILATPFLISKIRKNPELVKCFLYGEKADLAYVLLCCQWTEWVHN